jgi:subtilisin family serine protease
LKFEKGYPKISNLQSVLKKKGGAAKAVAAAVDTRSDTSPGTVTSGSTNDTFFNALWGLHNEGQTAGTTDADIDAREAWTVRTDCSTVAVGVIDSGIQLNHPDLSAHIWVNPGETAANGIDDDANGYIDDINGWDFVNNDNDPTDDNSHGTHVAGTIGAVGGNSAGVTGICQVASLVPLKASDAAGALISSDLVDAIDYAVAKGIKVTNNSWGGYVYSAAIDASITAANVANHLFIAASGNDGIDTDVTPHYPSSLATANIIAVAATDKNDALASFSNYGLTTVHMAAPGTYIYSTIIGSTYGYESGTSMATPLVAGAAAMVWAEHNAETMAQIRTRLTGRGDAISALTATTVSGRRLNLKSSVDP